MPFLVRSVLIILWCGGLLATVYFAGRQPYHGDQVDTKVTPPPFSELNPNLLGPMFLGHKSVYDDLAIIWMMQIFVNEELMRSQPEETLRAIHTVAKHEPKIEHFYLMSCFVLSRDLKKPEECEPLTKIGLKHFPNSFRLPMMQAYVSLFDLNETARAAAYYAMASSRENAPTYLPNLVKRLLAKEDANLNTEELTSILEELATDESHDAHWQKLFKEKYEEITAGDRAP